MEPMNDEQLSAKLEITYAAVELYAERGDDFTLHELAGRLDRPVGELFDYFPNKDAILEFFYTSLILRYRMMLDDIEDFNEYTLSEKLSNFTFATFDLLNEHPEFVRATFEERIQNAYHRTGFEEGIDELVRDFIRSDPRVSGSALLIDRPLVHRLLTGRFLDLVDFWLQDESEGRELTMELTDKLTALLQELLYNSVADQGIDLLKFIYNNKLWSRCIPFWDRLSSKIEIR